MTDQARIDPDLPRLIEQSLEALAARVGDPAPLVYDRLFALLPDARALFVGDRTGAARGEMLAMVFEVLMDLAAGGTTGANMIRAERVNHDGLGVTPEVFASFFGVVAQVVRDGAGPDWTPQMDAAWDLLLARAAQVVGES